MPMMESSTQTSQNRGQQARTQSSGLTPFFPNLVNHNRQAGAGNIWSNNLADSLSRETATASGQRSNGIGSNEASLWPRPSASTWNSADSQQFRSAASRSASPPTSLQNTSNMSPSFGSNRVATGQNTPYQSSSYMMNPYTTSQNALSSLTTSMDNTSGDNGYSFLGLQRGGQGLSSAFDDRDHFVPPSRHSESEMPLQYPEATGFGGGLGSHSRQQSRMSLNGASAAYVHQASNSRSQSHSFNNANDQTQAALDVVKAQLLRDRMQTNSPGSRNNVSQAANTAGSQMLWGDYNPSNGFNLTSGNLSESRRDSLANSVQQSSYSPRTYISAKQTDTWSAAPQSSADIDPISKIQRLQSQMSRQANQSPYTGQAAFNPYDMHAQLLQQMHPAYPLAFQNYNFAGQSYYPPTAPAGMAPRASRPQDMSTMGIRCQELEEFRRTSKSNRKWELKHVFGHVVEFAGDQQGSRFLQEKIPVANSDDRQRVFEEIMVDANALMVDVFGNYVVQQLFEHGTMVQKRALASKMKGQVAQLSTQLYGCRCVQEALEYVLVEQQVELAQELEPEIIRIMKSDNGNHVVQKILMKLPRDRIDFVYDAVRNRIFELSQQQFACRVIQRMIEKGTAADKEFILREFHEVAHRLVTDNWGNYVVQAVIRQGGPEARGKVIRLCIDQFLMFSKQKVASNVMEHCIEYGTEEDRLEMYRLITRQADDGTNLLQIMWKDNFANYVVQKLCHCLTGSEQAALVKESRHYFESRKKPSRPDEKWIAFEKLINQFSAPPSRQGSISSIGGGVGSRPQSQSGMIFTMPTPDLTTGGNSPRTSSSQGTDEAVLERTERYMVDQFSKASLREAGERQLA